jgi:hypothetical protein
MKTVVKIVTFLFYGMSWVAPTVYCLTTDWTTRVRSPAEAKDSLSSLFVQTSSEAHPAFCPVGAGGPFIGIKRGRVVTLITYLHLVQRARMSRSYISFPLGACMAEAG